MDIRVRLTPNRLPTYIPSTPGDSTSLHSMSCVNVRGVAVVAVTVVEASVPKAYPWVALASASITLGSVVRALRGEKGLQRWVVTLP